MTDWSDDPSHHEWRLLLPSYISLLFTDLETHTSRLTTNCMFTVVTMNLAHFTGYSMSYNIRDFDVTCHVVDVCVFMFVVVVVVVVVILFFITFFVVVKSFLLGFFIVVVVVFSLKILTHLDYVWDFKCWFISLIRKEVFYLTTHLTHFIYCYMATDIWLRTILIVRKETRCCHIGYSFRLTARVLLYAPSHRQDNTYHSLCYTSCGTLAGTRNINYVL